LALERAIALDPSDPSSRLMLGRVLREPKNLERAVEAFEEG
jgi:cytochrome c-type biogenesis protein CcmH/NrfG